MRPVKPHKQTMIGKNFLVINGQSRLATHMPQASYLLHGHKPIVVQLNISIL